jgi:DNA-binding NtrC family response regulator
MGLAEGLVTGGMMLAKVLVVEAEFSIAVALEDIAAELGIQIVGLFDSSDQALLSEKIVDIALVDVNLRDGPSGPAVGEHYAYRGATVVLMTSNPDMVAKGVPGAVGFLSKPVTHADLVAVFKYLCARRARQAAVPPKALKLFGIAA